MILWAFGSLVINTIRVGGKMLASLKTLPALAAKDWGGYKLAGSKRRGKTKTVGLFVTRLPPHQRVPVRINNFMHKRLT